MLWRVDSTQKDVADSTLDAGDKVSITAVPSKDPNHSLINLALSMALVAFED